MVNFNLISKLNHNYLSIFIESYYYGDLNREEVKDILTDADIGTFLIRDSTKDFDQKVMCVK